MKQIDLDEPILKFQQDGEVGIVTLGDTHCSILITGSLGSGKTSASFNTLILSVLRKNKGGLFLTCKPQDRDEIEFFCKETGRENDLIIIEPGNGSRPKYSFNFMEYISTNIEGAYSKNIVDTLMTVINSGDAKGMGSEDPFWQNSMEMLLQNVVELSMLAYGKVTIHDIHDIISTVPKIDEEFSVKEDSSQEKSSDNLSAFEKAFSAARDNINKKVDDWNLSRPDKDTNNLDRISTWDLYEAVPEARVFHLIHQFFFSNFITLSPKTRSTIEFMILGCLMRLLTEPVYSLFCRYQSNVTPNDCEKGKIIVLNLPIKIYEKAGRDAQILFKFLFMKSLERRKIDSESISLFLFIDEAQFFVTNYDFSFLTTVRSSCISTVWVTQNIPSLSSALSRHNSFEAVRGLLGCFGVKIINANADNETNNYFSALFGEAMYEEISFSNTVSKEYSNSKSKSYRWDKAVRPEEFTRLRMGGKRNNFKVEAYIYVQGKPIFPSKNQNFAKVTFQQKLTSKINN